MNRKQFFFLFSFSAILLFTACESGTATKDGDKKVSRENEITGAVILQDAKDYAEKQCYFAHQENLLKSDPGVQDYELKLKNIKLEKKKVKNFYLKKYNDFPTEKVAFQRAVKAARQDSEYCNKVRK